MRSDPPPYAWLGDPAQPFGPVGLGTTGGGATRGSTPWPPAGRGVSGR